MWKYTFITTECLETHMKDLHSLRCSTVQPGDIHSCYDRNETQKCKWKLWQTHRHFWQFMESHFQELPRDKPHMLSKEPMLEWLAQHLIQDSTALRGETRPPKPPFASALTSRTSLLSIIVPGRHFLRLGHPTFSAKCVSNHFFTRLIVITLCLTNTVDVRL